MSLRTSIFDIMIYLTTIAVGFFTAASLTSAAYFPKANRLQPRQAAAPTQITDGSVPLSSAPVNSPQNLNSTQGKPGSNVLQHYIAFGDSFSAGNRAGPNYDTSNCYRSDGSYPVQLLRDPDVFSYTAGFNFEACSGATTDSIRYNQVDPRGTSGYDLITLTAGGNDVNFAGIVWNCVYNPTPFVARRNCVNLLNAVAGIVAAGTTYDTNMRDIFDALTTSYASKNVVMLPYVQFYPSTVTGSCKTPADLRTLMNTGVDTVNAAIQRVAALYPAVTLVSSQSLGAAFDTHRFCDSATAYFQSNILDYIPANEQPLFLSNGTFTSSTLSTLSLMFNGNADPNGEMQIGNGTDDNPLVNPGLFHPTMDGYTQYKNSVIDVLFPAAAASTTQTQ